MFTTGLRSACMEARTRSVASQQWLGLWKENEEKENGSEEDGATLKGIQNSELNISGSVGFTPKQPEIIEFESPDSTKMDHLRQNLAGLHGPQNWASATLALDRMAQ
ncbi:hypothetical protein Nepgr_025785 [Nepenthes gracilis]|uniref:Uncharacterized protein n=1 Tax=Nepenthes gracilis TaxID=150966 RepID=A0AAD3T8J9_NEPGR|nr:hypothetical protein Nepgr_025785 [Nepenthes gracilis]